MLSLFFFFFNDTPTPEIYTLSLHDALPICASRRAPGTVAGRGFSASRRPLSAVRPKADRKSTRLNSSHSSISYAVFCLKKKKKIKTYHTLTHDLHNASRLKASYKRTTRRDL